MKPQTFILSPALYAVAGAAILAEIFLFLPDSLKRHAADPSFSNLALLAADGAVLVVVALFLTAVVTIREGLLLLRICGVPLFRTPIAEITTYSSSFPFLTFQREGGKKPRFCPAVIRKEQFLEALREINPNLREEVPPPKKGL